MGKPLFAALVDGNGIDGAALVAMYAAALAPATTSRSPAVAGCAGDHPDTLSDILSANSYSEHDARAQLGDLTAHGFAPVPRANADDRAHWAAVRRSGVALYGERPRKGCSPGTQRALRRAHGHTIICSASGCAALVDLQSARAAMRAAGRTSLAPGDGCASRSCSPYHAPAQAGPLPFHVRSTDWIGIGTKQRTVSEK